MKHKALLVGYRVRWHLAISRRSGFQKCQSSLRDVLQRHRPDCYLLEHRVQSATRRSQLVSVKADTFVFLSQRLGRNAALAAIDRLCKAQLAVNLSTQASAK